MAIERAARGSCAYRRARVSTADIRIVQENWERGTLWAGIVIAVSFGLMLAVGAWLGW